MVYQEQHNKEPVKRNRQQAPGRSPWIRVDGAEVSREKNDDGTYDVRIRGHNLRMIVSPPLIEIGGERLAAVKYEDDGKTIAGSVDKMPEGDRVVVDYGFARDEAEITIVDSAGESCE